MSSPPSQSQQQQSKGSTIAGVVVLLFVLAIFGLFIYAAYKGGIHFTSYPGWGPYYGPYYGPRPYYAQPAINLRL